MLLQFISEPTIGAKERRLIRSHVMKGKNVGKGRLPRSRVHHRSTITPARYHDGSNENEFHAKHILSLHRVFWNELSLTSYPCEINPEMERFVYQRLWTITKALYPLEFCTEVILSKYVWFQYVLSDQAFFHTLLAILSSFPTHFGGPRQISPEAIKHISQAYRMINDRLSSSEAYSDKAIAVVTMLAIYQRMHHQQSIGLVHFEGLRRMIELRNGLAQLSRENRVLAQKPWRLALEFALQDGSVPAFSVEDILHFSAVSIPIVSSTGSTAFHIPIEPRLLAHLTSISSFTHHLNITPTKLDPLDYSDAVCLHLHRLLDYAPLNSVPTSSLNDLTHLTLVAIMTTLMPEYGHNQAQYDVLVSRLQCALQVMKDDVNCEVLLWTVFVGYATILHDGKDEERLVMLGAEMCTRLDLHDWIDVHDVLCRYACIHVLYDKAGLKLLRMINEKKREWIM